MMSAAYRQASRRDPGTVPATRRSARPADPEAVDPANELLWRMRLRRLESEVVRDSILAVSGQLNRAMGGPPVPIGAQPDGMVVVAKDRLAQPVRRLAPQRLPADPPGVQPVAVDGVRSAAGGHELPGARRVGRSPAVAGDAQRRVCRRAGRALRRPDRAIGRDDRQTNESRWHFAWRWPAGPTLANAPRAASCSIVKPSVSSCSRRDARSRGPPGARATVPRAAQHQRVPVCGMIDRQLAVSPSEPPPVPGAGDAWASARWRWRTCWPANRLAPRPRRRTAPGGFDLRARPGHAPPRATAVIMLMQVGGPSHIDLFDPKPELQKRDGQPYPDDVEMLQPGSENKKLMATPVQVQAARPVRHGDFGAAAVDRLGGRRSVPGALDVRRQQQPSAGHAVLEHGQDFSRPAGAGLVDQLCPGHRESEPAGLRRAARSGRLQQRRHDHVGKRLAAGHLSRHRDPIARRGGARLAPGRHDARGRAAKQSSGAGAVERGTPPALPARNRARRPHPQLRAGRADAAQRRARARPGRRDAGHARAVRARRSDDREFWHALPDGAAAGRVGRALRPGAGADQVGRGALGPSRKHQAGPGGPLPSSRSAHGRH